MVVDGGRPVILAGGDGFLIPIGSFDQAYRDRIAPFFCPDDQILQVLVAIAEVGLEGDSNIRAIAKLSFHQQGFKYRQGRVFITILFHIKMHRRPYFLRLTEQDPQSIADLCLRASDIEGIELGIKCREFD